MFIQTKKFILGIGILTVALLIAGLIVGFYSLRYMKEIVSDQFNQQQLELAQHAARQLENQFSKIIQDLTTLNQSPSVPGSLSGSSLKKAGDIKSISDCRFWISNPMNQAIRLLGARYSMLVTRSKKVFNQHPATSNEK